MRDDDWYGRNRARDLVITMFRVVRQVQLLFGFKDSVILKTLVAVYREDDGDSLVALHLWYAIREIERSERRNS